MTSRNYSDPAYTKWRKAVRQRDNGRCRFPGCTSSDRLQVHHIRRWADHPTIRYQVSNGITLCHTHHKLVTKHEDMYATLFIRIVTAG